MINNNFLRLDVLRHGETTLSHTLRGHLDDALTEQGWLQMQHTLDAYLQQKPDWDAVITSSLQRCQTFAQHVSQTLQLPIVIEPNLKEYNFGDWEGKTTLDIYQHTPEQLAKFWEKPSIYSPPNAETLFHFQQRIQQGLVDLIQNADVYRWKRMLMIGHGGVIKLLKCLAEPCEIDQLLTQSAPLATIHSFCLDRTQAGVHFCE